jgi:hypothetical protein
MNLTDEEKIEKFDKMSESRTSYNKRRNAKIILLCRKATEANIEVSDKEIDEYLS